MNTGDTTNMTWLTTTLNVETVSKIMVTLIAIVGALWAMVPSVSLFLRVRLAAYILSSAKLQYTRGLPAHLLPRTTLMNALQKALDDTDFNTVLVYGIRGSGKTTAIEKRLSKRAGVLQWTLSATDGPAATTELKDKWTEVFLPWTKPGDRNFDMRVCQTIKHISKNNNTLAIIVSVESSAKPSALKAVLHFCKTMSYNTQLVRFIVDISSSRVAVALQTDLKKLRISQVFVGRITQPEAHSLLGRNLPQGWTDPKKQTVSLAITDKFDWILLNLIEVCKELEEGMSIDEAIAHVNKIYEGELMVAENRWENFDTLVGLKLGEMQVQVPPPKLFKENTEGLDQDGLRALKKMLSFPVLVSLVSEVGAPYIFEIDPFTESISLNGRLMKTAFVQHYKVK